MMNLHWVASRTSLRRLFRHAPGKILRSPPDRCENQSPSCAGRSPMEYEKRASLSVSQPLLSFVEREALPGTGIEPPRFWEGLAALISRLAPRNRELLAKRDLLQSRIDQWYEARGGEPVDVES